MTYVLVVLGAVNLGTAAAACYFYLRARADRAERDDALGRAAAAADLASRLDASLKALAAAENKADASDSLEANHAGGDPRLAGAFLASSVAGVSSGTPDTAQGVLPPPGRAPGGVAGPGGQ